MSKTISVTVLRGGPSSEREVSLESGAAVADACRRLGYCVFESDIGPDHLGALDHQADVIFPVLHGTFGEDGQLQAILEKRGLAYVGCDAAASRLAMDKNATKEVWRRAGLPTAPWTTVDSPALPLAMPCDLRPPVVVKPVAEGSSIGVYLCDTIEALEKAVAEGVPAHGVLLVEKRLCGPELTVGVLGETAMPIIQIKPADGFFDFQAKYQRNDTAFLFDTDLDEETYRRVQDLAIQAFRASGCRDFSRIDFIVDCELGPQLLEVNTIPGFTGHSLMPKAAAKAGIPFDSLVERLVEMALRRKM